MARTVKRAPEEPSDAPAEKKTRQRNGQGWVAKDPSRPGTWHGHIDVAGKTYKRRGRTQGIVRMALDKARLNAIAGTMPASTKAYTVGTWLDHWLVTHASARRAATRQYYESLIRTHIKPAIGKFPLRKLTAEQLDTFLATLKDNGVGDRTRQAIVATLRVALGKALERNHVQRNIALSVEKPKVYGKVHAAPSAEVLGKILREARRNPRTEVFALLCMAGCRRGEALGFKWGDIDEQRGVIQVNRHVVKLSAALGSYTVVEGAKTSAGARAIPLFPLLRDALVRLRAQLIEESEADAKGKVVWKTRRRPGARVDEQVYPPSDPRCWILPNLAGHMQSPDNIVRAYKQLLGRAGLVKGEHTIHGLRHDFAGLLGELGTPQHVTMGLIGHSKPSMLTAYQHATDAAGRDAMDRLNGYLEGLA